jgi:hypothetical protein
MTPFWPEKVASRPEISPAILHALLRQATAVVHDRLLASATSQMRVAIGDVFAKVSVEVGAHVRPRDYRAAQKLVLRISSAAGLSESVLTGFCRENKFEESVVTLPRSRRCRHWRPSNGERSFRPRADPVQVLCKAANLSWPAVKALIMLRTSGNGMSTSELDDAYANYGRLPASTTQRVVRFCRCGRRTNPQAKNTRLRSPETQSRRKIKKQDGRCARAALA